MELPAGLPTGNYRLSAYTHYMRNEEESLFFHKIVSILNPFEKDNAVPVDSTGITPAIAAVQSPGSTLSVTTDQTAYSRRSEVQLRLSGVPENIHSLTVSVAGNDIDTGLPSSTLAGWQKSLLSQPPYPVADTYLPEYEGHIIEGRIVDTETGTPANGRGLAPMFAFVGDNITLFKGQTHHESSQVTFYTRRITGKREAATVAFSLEDKDKFRVDMVSPFVKHSFKEPPRLSLHPEWEKVLQKRAIGVQAAQLYIADSVSRTEVIPGYIRTQPDWVYKLDEYVRFPTMQDIVIEFITPLRFTRRGQDRSLSVLTEERMGF
ncbi:MAG: hypothetical protein LUE93_12540 [Bacteroides sp.]|nr:hypothetical protein [Bacteroides sp.]